MVVRKTRDREAASAAVEIALVVEVSEVSLARDRGSKSGCTAQNRNLLDVNLVDLRSVYTAQRDAEVPDLRPGHLCRDRLGSAN
jgi:hypothetical protein